MTDHKKEVNNFCVTRPITCTMNYCDENGCQDRKRNLVEENSAHSYTEGSEPIKLTDEQRIEKEAEAYADSFDRRGCTIWQGMYRGYKGGANAERQQMNTNTSLYSQEVIDSYEEQLKQRDETIKELRQEIANHIAVNSLLTDSDGEADLANKLYNIQSELMRKDEELKLKDQVIIALKEACFSLKNFRFLASEMAALISDSVRFTDSYKSSDFIIISNVVPPTQPHQQLPGKSKP